MGFGFSYLVRSPERDAHVVGPAGAVIYFKMGDTESPEGDRLWSYPTYNPSWEICGRYQNRLGPGGTKGESIGVRFKYLLRNTCAIQVAGTEWFAIPLIKAQALVQAIGNRYRRLILTAENVGQDFDDKIRTTLC